MGGGTHRTATSDRVAAHAPPRTPPERIHAPVIPAPPSRHSCAGRNRATPPPPPFPHPSPLLGGRLGGGWEAPSQRSSGRPAPPRTPPERPASRHSPRLIPALSSPSVIPAQAGTTRSSIPTPLRDSVIPAQAGMGAAASARHAPHMTARRTPIAGDSFCAPTAHSCLRRNDGIAKLELDGWGREERTRSVRPLATSHPPPNLPPKRGEG